MFYFFFFIISFFTFTLRANPLRMFVWGVCVCCWVVWGCVCVWCGVASRRGTNLASPPLLVTRRDQSPRETLH